MPRRRGRPPPGRTWPAPRGAAGRSGRAGRSDLPEISQFRGRHPYPDPPQTAHRQQKRRHFCRHILRKRYAARAALFGICTDVRPGPAGRRLRELPPAVRALLQPRQILRAGAGPRNRRLLQGHCRQAGLRRGAEGQQSQGTLQ